MKRAFSLGSGPDRILISIETDGARISVRRKKGDGPTQRTIKELKSDSVADAEAERMSREFLAQGYTERTAAEPVKASRPSSASSSPYDDLEAPAAREEPILARLAIAPAGGSSTTNAPKKKKSGKKKKKKGAERGDELDKRVIGAVIAVGLSCVAIAGYMLYDGLLKPQSIVGVWAGSMIEFETGKAIIHTQYRLVLDDKNNASMTLQEKYTTEGTYTLQGDLLTMNLHDKEAERELKAMREEAKKEAAEDAKNAAAENAEKGEPREDGDKEMKDEDENDLGQAFSSEKKYKVKIRRGTLDLFEPKTGKLVVQLIRGGQKPGGGPKPAPAAPTDLAQGANAKADPDADARLAPAEFSAKDGAFRLHHPRGWKTDTGARSDNTYSWVKLTGSGAEVSVTADIQGSLISGSDSAQPHEEGSELAPVHIAHNHHKKAVSDDFSNYSESEPTLFKAGLGEGRIASFTASGGSLFASKIQGYRVTLLTRDRRVTVLCHCAVADFAKLKPTFLAICRSVGH